MHWACYFARSFGTRRCCRAIDFTNGWRDLFARGLEIVELPGDHFSMMSDGHITTVARQIKAVLDRYEAVQDLEMAEPDNAPDARVMAR